MSGTEMDGGGSGSTLAHPGNGGMVLKLRPGFLNFLSRLVD